MSKQILGICQAINAFNRKSENKISQSTDDFRKKYNIKIYKEDMFIIVEILDNGKSIAEEHKSELFKPGKTFGKYNGTGFGLVNAKRIVEAHGGQIGFESELGVGTKFFVKIPNV